MSTAVLSYEPERIRALVVRARAVAEHLASAPPDDPLAAEAATTAATVHAHVSEHWLPALAAVEASRALLDPIDLTNAEALAAAHSAVVAGQPGVFVGTTKTYEVLETSPTTTIPTTGHDPDAGSAATTSSSPTTGTRSTTSASARPSSPRHPAAFHRSSPASSVAPRCPTM